MKEGKASSLAIRPIWRGWFGLALALPAFAIAAVLVDEGTHLAFASIWMTGAILVVAATAVAAFARSQRLFIVLSTLCFGVAGGALVYLLRHGNELGPVFLMDGSKQALLVAGAAMFGGLGAGVLGRRLYPSAGAYVTSDQHHSALQRAAALSILTAIALTSTLTPTRFWWVTPIMLALGVAITAVVLRRDVALERKLTEIVSGKHDTHSVVSAEGADELPRLMRWGGPILGLEHGYIVAKKVTGSYRDLAEEDEKVTSVAIDRLDRVPRVVLLATSALSVIGLVSVLAFVVMAPIISVPSNIRTLYGPTTRAALRGRHWIDDRATLPNDVILYDVDSDYRTKIAGAPPYRWIGYDRAKGAILSPPELFSRLAKGNTDAEFLAEAAVNLLLDTEQRYADEKPHVEGRELRFGVVTSSSSSMMGERYTKYVARCSVNLDTAVLDPCGPVQTILVDYANARPPGDGDPHHMK